MPVLALSLDGDGPQSSTVSATTPAAPRPAAPTGLNASQVSHSVLTLTWNDPQDVRITGYRILRGTDVDSLATLEEDTGSSSTLYTDATVEPETNYFYAVNALSADGDGDQSRAISATTPAAPQSEEQPVQNDPPEAPTGLTASSIEHDSLTLTWDDPQDDSITGQPDSERNRLQGPADHRGGHQKFPVRTTPTAPWTRQPHTSTKSSR